MSRKGASMCACIHMSFVLEEQELWVQIQSDLEKVTNKLTKPQFTHLPIVNYYYPSYSIVVEIKINIPHQCFVQNLAPWEVLNEWQQSFQRRAVRIIFLPNYIKNIGSFKGLVCF